MGINESRQEQATGQVDHLRTARGARSTFGLTSHEGDPLELHQHALRPWLLRIHRVHAPADKQCCGH